MQTGSLVAIAILVLGVSLFSAIIVFIVLQNRGSDSTPSPQSVTIPDEAFAGLPAAPPETVFSQSLKDSEIGNIKLFMSALFYSRSNCWHANYFFRVTCMNLIKGAVAQMDRIIKITNKDAREAALIAWSVQLRRSVEASAITAFSKCPPDAIIIGADKKQLTIKEWLAKGGVQV